MTLEKASKIIENAKSKVWTVNGENMKLVQVTALLATLTCAGCTSQTEYGTCIGIGEKQDKKLRYKPSVRNITVGLIFSAFIFPPIDVAINKLFCPVGLNEEEANDGAQ